MCSSGTKTPLTATSLLPVPRSPATCQVSMTSTSPIGMHTLRSRCRPSSSEVQVGKYHSAWQELLAKSQRPSTTKPPSTRRACPRGRFEPAKRQALPTVPGASAARPYALAEETWAHQPTEPSARAKASMARKALTGSTSAPPLDAGRNRS